MSVCPSQYVNAPRRKTLASEVPSESSCSQEHPRHNHTAVCPRNASIDAKGGATHYVYYIGLYI